jgi:outer membrane lipoprotein-sorting protein
MRRLVVLSLFLGGCAQAAAAQTVDEIVEKHLAASGGRAALQALKSRTLSGTILVSIPGGELPGEIEILSQAPNKVRTLLTVDLSALGAGKLVFDQRFDGKNGYVIDTRLGNRDITGTELENLTNQSWFPTSLLNYKQAGTGLKLEGKAQIGGRDAYTLLVEPKVGPAMRQYIDAESYLLVREVATAFSPDIGPFEQTTDLLDYRDVDGFKVPFRAVLTSSVQNVAVTIMKVEHNAAIDEALLSKPPK